MRCTDWSLSISFPGRKIDSMDGLGRACLVRDDDGENVEYCWDSRS